MQCRHCGQTLVEPRRVERSRPLREWLVVVFTAWFLAPATLVIGVGIASSVPWGLWLAAAIAGPLWWLVMRDYHRFNG